MENMKDKVFNFISQKELISPNDKLIIAVSGGIDSMALLHFMNHYFNNKIMMAHCNFQLRGDESNADEDFVRNYANSLGLEFVTKRFNTISYSRENKMSVQMAARELRYSWFPDLIEEYNYDKILLAHHSGDVVESFFINLIRGSGLNGLRGIKAKAGRYIRPFLNISRDEIVLYQKENDIEYREDSSNRSDKYLRNHLRHHIIPQFKKLRADFEQHLINTIEILDDTGIIFDQHVESLLNKMIRQKENSIHLPIAEIDKLPAKRTYLFEFLKNYGFSGKDIPQILNSFSSIPGKTFNSSSHKLIKDREDLILVPLNEKEREQIYIQEDLNEIEHPLRLQFEVLDADEVQSYKSGKNIAYFDKDKIEYPLILRHWHKGEYFVPFGSEHFKKVSDFFIDQKMDLFAKQNCWILASANKIIWILNRRTDNRFRVTPDTQKVLKITADIQ